MIRANYLAAIITFLAGLVDIISMFYRGITGLDFMIQLLVVLLIFWNLGSFLEWLLVTLFKKMMVKPKTAEEIVAEIEEMRREKEGYDEEEGDSEESDE